MEKKEWEKPVLTIIKRDKPEENVLLACDQFGYCGPESASQTS